MASHTLLLWRVVGTVGEYTWCSRVHEPILSAESGTRRQYQYFLHPRRRHRRTRSIENLLLHQLRSCRPVLLIGRTNPHLHQWHPLRKQHVQQGVVFGVFGRWRHSRRIVHLQRAGVRERTDTLGSHTMSDTTSSVASVDNILLFKPQPMHQWPMGAWI